MNASQPPHIATWLLKRLATGPRRESLIGDLMEQYRKGRSVPWYWRQVLVAIVVSLCRDIWMHKLLAARAIVTGYVALSFFSLLSYFALNALAKQLPPSWQEYHLYYPRGIEMVALVLMCIATFGSGWIVARWHRAHQAAMVLAYLVSFLVYALINVAAVPQRLFYHSYLYNLSTWAVAIALYSTSILLGGLWGARTDGEASTRIHVK